MALRGRLWFEDEEVKYDDRKRQEEQGRLYLVAIKLGRCADVTTLLRLNSEASTYCQMCHAATERGLTSVFVTSLCMGPVTGTIDVEGVSVTYQTPRHGTAVQFGCQAGRKRKWSNSRDFKSSV